MTTLREQIATTALTVTKFRDLMKLMRENRPNDDLEIIKKAYEFSQLHHAGQTRASGEPYIAHPLQVALVLAEMKMDAVAVTAGLLHDSVEDTSVTIVDIRKEFGEQVAHIVEGASQLTTSYMFSWYNNVKLNTELRFANAGSSPTTITVTIGGVNKRSYLVQPNKDKRVSYVGLDSGPVKVEGSDPTVPIIASERIAYISGGVQTSYSEIMGIPPDQLSDTYWFPIYDNVSRNTALSFGNVGATGTTVIVTIAGVVRGTYDLAPSQSIRPRLAGVNDGPVLVQSSGNVPIIASERFAYTPNNGVTYTGFSEMNGLPESQLRSTYLFSWYNNIKLNTQLRFGVP